MDIYSDNRPEVVDNTANDNSETRDDNSVNLFQIHDKLQSDYKLAFYHTPVPKDDIMRLSAYSNLMMVASYFNGNWFPDWNDKSQTKYYIKFNTATQTFSVYDTHTIHPGVLAWFATKHYAEETIRIMGNNLYILYNLDGLQK